MLLQLALVFSVSLLPGGASQDHAHLAVIDIQPCTRSTMTVSQDESIVYTIYANFSNCLNFTSTSSYVSVITDTILYLWCDHVHVDLV